MLTQTLSSTIDRQQEQNVMLRTQVGGNGNGGRSIPAVLITGPDDNEPQAAVLAAEALLIRQRINTLLNVTDRRNETNPRTSLREQRAYATLAIFDEGGAM